VVQDGEHSKIKPRPPRVSMREQLRREGLLDSDDEVRVWVPCVVC
jgi:hypothetical protein